MATLKNKISVHVPSMVPDFVSGDHPIFVEFLKTYYEFLESAELALVNLGSKDALLTEEGSTNLLLLENKNFYRTDRSDRILAEDSPNGAFSNNETVVGQTSKATAIVRVEDINSNSRLFISSQNKFVLGEQIVGQTSGATGYISNYTANPVQNVQDLLEYDDVDGTIDSFFAQFKDSFMRSIPKKLITGLDHKTLLKHIKDLYRAKGTLHGHKLFFRILLGEEVEIEYPTRNLTRVSDGVWSEDTIITVIQKNDLLVGEKSYLAIEELLQYEDGNNILLEDSLTGLADFSQLVGQLITQASADGTNAVVDTLFKYNFGGEFVTELVLNAESIEGTFLPGRTIRGFSNVDQITEIEAKVVPVAKDAGLDHPDFQTSQYYDLEDKVTITSNTGNFGTARISEISTGTIEKIIVDTGAAGYVGGELISVDNTNTDGTGLAAQVSIVNGGFGAEDASVTGNFRFDLENEVGEFLSETSEFSYEIPTGTFHIGETITGLTSDATGIVVENLLDVKVIQYNKTGVSSFIIGETVKGSTSAYTVKLIEDTENIYLANEADLEMSSTDRFILEDETLRGDSYSGAAIVQEIGTGTGDITDIRVTAQGFGYTSLPKLTLSSGSGVVRAVGTNVGNIAGIQMVMHGSHYTNSDITFETNTNLLCIDISGVFTFGEILTGLTSGSTATVVSQNSDTGIIKVNWNTARSFDIGETIEAGSSGETAVVYSFKRTNLPGTTGTLVKKTGRYISDKGFISESTKKIQDSYYWQDFSYVVKASQSIVQWRDDLLATVHPAGWAVFGQVDIASKIKSVAKIASISERAIVDLGALYKVVFANVIGRRLGTTDQLPLNPNPMLPANEPSGEPYYATRLEVAGTGTFDVGDIITGSSSGATGQVVTDLVDDSGQRTVTYRPATRIFTTADTITGTPSGTTATVLNVYGLTGERDVTLRHEMFIKIHTHRTTDNGLFYAFRPNYGSGDAYKFAPSQETSRAESFTFRGHPVYRFLMPLATLPSNISNSVETFIISSTDGFPGVGTVLIGNEYLDYISAVGGVLDCSGAGTRGALGSTAAPHSADDKVYVVQWVPKQDTTTGYRIKDWVKDQYGQDITLDNLINHPEYKNNISPPSEVMIYKS